MRSVDTNVVVRYLVADDIEQFRRSEILFETGNLVILTSVLLETEWVLRSAYRLPKRAVIEALRCLASHKGVQVQDVATLNAALDFAERGLDFADALHLAGSAAYDDFVSFDRRFARRAAAIGSIPVVEP